MLLPLLLWDRPKRQDVYKWGAPAMFLTNAIPGLTTFSADLVLIAKRKPSKQGSCSHILQFAASLLGLSLDHAQNLESPFAAFTVLLEVILLPALLCLRQGHRRFPKPSQVGRGPVIKCSTSSGCARAFLHSVVRSG